MPANVLIALAALYVAAYYLLGRSALQDLKRVDPEHYDRLGASAGASAKNSLAIMEIMFDNRCPKSFYPAGVKRKVFAARSLLYLSPLVFIVVIALL